ncbi:MAG: hypothetical protein EXS13_02750 [Planctomycetes bacterium]|nr:hypothetical protein [Planctomycetota bacterium]
MSDRLEEGWLGLGFSAVAADGTVRPFAHCTRSTQRNWRCDGRVVLHGMLALLVLLLAAASRGRGAAWTLAAATIGELAFFGARYQATTPVERIPAVVEPIPWLQQRRAALGPYRLFTARTHLHPNLHLPHGIEVTRGYDALEPLGYVRLLDELAPGRVVPWVQMDFGTLDFASQRGRAIADLLGVRWFLSEEAPPADFREVWRRESLAVWENPTALPRAFTVQRGQPLRQVVERGLDPRTVACFDDDLASAREIGFGGSGRVTRLDHARGRLRAEVESDGGTIVVFSENFGGWEATLDGQPVAIARSHMSLQSVVVPLGGRHRVEFRYRPRSVIVGVAISAGALAIVTALLLSTLRRRAPPVRGGKREFLSGASAP